MWLGSLPFIGLFLCWWILAPGLGRGSWRRGALRATVIWGLYSILTLELLSLFELVTRPVMLVLWIVSLILLLSIKVFEMRRLGRPAFSFHWLPDGALGKALAGLMLVVILITAVVAWLTPPNTWDSLNYHMPRIAQWAQMDAVRHFATGIEVQNSMPPSAEMLILHNYVLAQGDRWANFVAWIAVWVSVLGVSLIAKQLGASKQGQWLTAAFAASLPTALIQASSTMTDAVVGLWVIVVAAETIPLMFGERLSWRSAIFMSAAAGLAILTKPIAFAYLLPFALYVGYVLLRRTSWRRTVLMALLAVVVATGVNLGHFSRNYALYENPITEPGRIAVHGSPWLGGRAFMSNLVRNLTMHAATPSAHVNKGITFLVQEFHGLLGLEVNDPRTTVSGVFKVRWGETNEDKATNPLHFYFLLISLAVLSLMSRPTDNIIFRYLAFPAAIFIVFSAMFQWQIQSGRFHTPWFMLLAPAAGIVWKDRLGRSWLISMGIALIVLSWPWLLQIKSRPLVEDAADSYVGSILTSSRSDLYLANAQFMEEPLSQFSRVASRGSCQDYGILLNGGAPEYLWWVWLDGPESSRDIHWIVEGTASDQLVEEDLDVCGVVCQGCDRERSEYRGLPLVESRADFSLYLDNE